MLTFNKRDLAHVLNLSQRRIDQLVEERVLVRIAPNTFVPAQAHHAYTATEILDRDKRRGLGPMALAAVSWLQVHRIDGREVNAASRKRWRGLCRNCGMEEVTESSLTTAVAVLGSRAPKFS